MREDFFFTLMKLNLVGNMTGSEAIENFELRVSHKYLNWYLRRLGIGAQFDGH